jgi:hypothetical protein
MTRIISSRIVLALAIPVFMGLAAAADTPPLRLDLIPKEHLKNGRYQPTRGKVSIPDMPRDKLICFCLYTTHRGTLKLNAQLYPLKDGESRKVQLHLDRGDGFKQVAENDINPVGWSTVFRVDNWDVMKPAKYRVTHAGGSRYEGMIRKDPRDKETIVVGNLSCNSSTDRNMRPDIVANLKAVDPDLLFFAGDQSYDHKEHIAAWLLFGRQFGEVIKDRPTVTIPDDHDVGHPNLWGGSGKLSTHPNGADGGYIMPVEYVNMVQRMQTAHLPDPFDPRPVLRGITVYYTSLNVGGIDFAILEDRKWKSGPYGLVKVNGPRPDHVTDPKFDPRTIDVPEAELLGERQLHFLDVWGKNWDGATMKCVLSQTPFANAAHLHGRKLERLVADLDSNGWPQSGRNAALRTIRKSFAFMMSGDQHISTVLHHGVNDWGDSGWQFTSPSIWNLYGRAWQPLEKNTRPFKSVLPFAGDFHDGFGNKITVAAYANPTDENYAATGFGIVRFNKKSREITMECWPRFVDVTKPGATQYAGWPLTVTQEDNYGRKPLAWLPTVKTNIDDPVIQVIDELSGEVEYTLRISGREWRPKAFRIGPHTIRVGTGKDDWKEFKDTAATFEMPKETIEMKF